MQDLDDHIFIEYLLKKTTVYFNFHEVILQQIKSNDQYIFLYDFPIIFADWDFIKSIGFVNYM